MPRLIGAISDALSMYAAGLHASSWVACLYAVMPLKDHSFTHLRCNDLLVSI